MKILMLEAALKLHLLAFSKLTIDQISLVCEGDYS